MAYRDDIAAALVAGRDYLRGLLKRSSSGSTDLGQRRKERLDKLQGVAEIEEAKNKQLQERLDFRRQEQKSLDRVQEARTGKVKLLESLGEYKAGRGMTWKGWLLIIGALFVVLLFFGKC